MTWPKEDIPNDLPQLHVDLQCVAGPPYRPLDDEIDAELLADVRQVARACP